MFVNILFNGFCAQTQRLNNSRVKKTTNQQLEEEAGDLKLGSLQTDIRHRSSLSTTNWRRSHAVGRSSLFVSLRVE